MSAIQKMTKIWYDPNAPRHRQKRTPTPADIPDILNQYRAEQGITQRPEEVYTHVAPPPNVRENLNRARMVAEFEREFSEATWGMTEEQKRKYAAANYQHYLPLIEAKKRR